MLIYVLENCLRKSAAATTYTSSEPLLRNLGKQNVTQSRRRGAWSHADVSLLLKSRRWVSVKIGYRLEVIHLADAFIQSSASNRDIGTILLDS